MYVQYLHVVETGTTREIRKAFVKLSTKEQETFDQTQINVDQLLALNVKKIYTVEDLKSESIFKSFFTTTFFSLASIETNFTRE